jgi:hypothetical protein
LPIDLSVSVYVLRELLRPEAHPAPGPICVRAIEVTMPETAVDKNYGLVLGKHNVWFARQIAAVQPESEAHPVKSRPHNALRSRVRAAYPRHIPASARL